MATIPTYKNGDDWVWFFWAWFTSGHSSWPLEYLAGMEKMHNESDMTSFTEMYRCAWFCPKKWWNGAFQVCIEELSGGSPFGHTLWEKKYLSLSPLQNHCWLMIVYKWFYYSIYWWWVINYHHHWAWNSFLGQLSSSIPWQVQKAE